MKLRGMLGRVEEVRTQYGALPFRCTEGLEILLITSRETRRWVIPKGWPMRGRPPRGTAAREAFEEAGITGKISRAPIGAYTYTKRGLGRTAWPCRVDVFPLKVGRERADWPERLQRERCWFAFLEAADLVREPGLRSLILGFGVAFDALVR